MEAEPPAVTLTAAVAALARVESSWPSVASPVVDTEIAPAASMLD